MRFHKLKRDRLQILRDNLNNPEYLETAILGIGLRTANSMDQDQSTGKRKKLIVRRFIK